MNSVEFLYGGGGEVLVSMKKLPVKIECFQEKREEITDEKIMKLYQMNHIVFIQMFLKIAFSADFQPLEQFF